MADDDEDKGRKTNVDRDHKPAQEARQGYAPRGAEGRPAASGPTPGLGSRTTRQAADHSTQQSSEPEPQKYIDPAKDNRPAFHETDDKELNDFYKKTHRMIPKDAPERGTSNEGPRISQSDFAKAFRQASAKTQSMQRSRGIDHD